VKTRTVIDCDVHHAWRRSEDVLPYMSSEWQAHVKGPGPAGLLPISAPSTFQNPQGGNRDDAIPASGGPPGSDYETLRADLFETMGVGTAVLTYGEGLFVDSNPNPFLAAEIAKASNDWTVDQWLNRDDRLKGSILVSNQNPLLAAKEIRRLGNHPQMCQVLMAVNGLGPPFGHPLFHPIYAAASEFDLPIALHVPGHGGNSPVPTAAGMVNFYFEYHVLISQTIQTHLVSFIANGVFERYPSLKLVLVEGGVAWLPSVIWRLDADWKRLSGQAPSLKKPPSEYFREHVFATTQPLEASTTKQELVEMLEFLSLKDQLLFSTDYPHWDTDQVSYVATRLPAEWHDAIFYQNAQRLYGFEVEKPMARQRSN
jgi:uncharacterized protein